MALSGPDQAPTLEALVESGRIEPRLISITLCPTALAEHLGVAPAQINQEALSLVGAFTLLRRGGEARLVLGDRSCVVDRKLL